MKVELAASFSGVESRSGAGAVGEGLRMGVAAGSFVSWKDDCTGYPEWI